MFFLKIALLKNVRLPQENVNRRIDTDFGVSLDFCGKTLWYSCSEEPQREPISAALCEKSPNTEFFRVRILPYLD